MAHPRSHSLQVVESGMELESVPSVGSPSPLQAINLGYWATGILGPSPSLLKVPGVPKGENNPQGPLPPQGPSSPAQSCVV